MSESEQHNAVVRLIDEFPEVLRAVLTKLGTPPPAAARVQSIPTNFSVQQDPLDNTLEGKRRHVDNAAVFAVGDKWNVCVVFEHQGKPSTQKIFRWIQYVAQALERANPAAHPELQDVCPVKLVVVTANEETIRWSQQAYKNLTEAHRQVGQEFFFRPVFVGPKQLPEIIDPAVAQADVALAALTATVHPQSLDAAMLALKSALAVVTEYQKKIIFAALVHCIAPRHVEELTRMSTEFEQYVGSFGDIKLAEGRREGQADGQLRTLREVAKMQLEKRFPDELSKAAGVAGRIDSAEAGDLKQVLQVLGSVDATWDQLLGALSNQKQKSAAGLLPPISPSQQPSSQAPEHSQGPERGGKSRKNTS